MPEIPALFPGDPDAALLEDHPQLLTAGVFGRRSFPRYRVTVNTEYNQVRLGTAGLAAVRSFNIRGALKQIYGRAMVKS
jgi:hypothetical protein